MIISFEKINVLGIFFRLYFRNIDFAFVRTVCKYLSGNRSTVVAVVAIGFQHFLPAHLKKADLEDGHITYRRRKTGQCLCVAWTQEMQYISDKYNLATSPYLLPLISPGSKNTRVAYRNVAYRINRSLKIIGAMIGYGSPLTLYCARHSWASIAQAKNIPVSVISAGMGHNSEKTTRIYLASLDTSTVDRANSIILKALR